jgi:dTDP-4-dehydrorhamnose 3,5-epimerase
MKVEETELKGCWLIHDNLYKDERGYFAELYNDKRFEQATGLEIKFVQDNISQSVKGVLRGIHFQNGEAAQAKWVRVLQGKVLDVAVDLRKNSETFGKHFSVTLTGDSNTSLFIPRGFGHAFLVLSDTALFFYKCDNHYNGKAEGGIIYNDPHLAIDWMLPESDLIVSQKDKLLPSLNSYQQTL